MSERGGGGGGLENRPLSRPEPVRQGLDVRALRLPLLLRAQSGFTLVELVAAFAIFAIGVSIALSIGANALGMAKRSSEYTRAALHAQSILDVVGVGEPLSEGSDAGEFDDGYRWELAVTQQEPPAAATGAIEELPIELYRLELVVRWGDEREAKFTTLRATSPSLGGASPQSPGGQR